MKGTNKCYEIGQSLGTVSSIVFESLGIYIATKSINNAPLLPGGGGGAQHVTSNNMLVYSILSGLGKVAKNAIDYGFEYICDNDNELTSNEIYQDSSVINSSSTLVNEQIASSNENV